MDEAEVFARRRIALIIECLETQARIAEVLNKLMDMRAPDVGPKLRLLTSAIEGSCIEAPAAS